MSRSDGLAKGMNPVTPVSEVAANALQNRLETVWRFAQLAARQTDYEAKCNEENVHQLRVGVRRANAALALYGVLLPKSKNRRLQKQLRTLRKAAGPARDLDVFSRRLATSELFASLRGLDQLITLLRTQRKETQRALKRGYRSVKKNGFNQLRVEVVMKVKWRGLNHEPAFDEFARDCLTPILERFFVALSGDLSATKALHQLRITGKAARYAVELLTPAFDKSKVAEVSLVLKQFQEQLGGINDHASAVVYCQRNSSLLSKNQNIAIVQQILTLEKNELRLAIEEFRSWCTPQRIREMRLRFASLIHSSVIH